MIKFPTVAKLVKATVEAAAGSESSKSSSGQVTLCPFRSFPISLSNSWRNREEWVEASVDSTPLDIVLVDYAMMEF